ncbi:hypothetical protein IQ266_04390 [filamentous cyanobacterium LEGE 11480]|uniref:IS1 family transposase n=1 Tax=Romeriopsis navalis LEGE 11480 TaxID=2777977 RepID=A0A928Z358_9CYAN|nr:hypothetical protein [Romeriopsis navalis LEGE 11480]
MECPACGSPHIRKNGIKAGKQNHLCVYCRRPFIIDYEAQRGYPDEVRAECLKL